VSANDIGFLAATVVFVAAILLAGKYIQPLNDREDGDAGDE
jgi:hypothetical protein